MQRKYCSAGNLGKVACCQVTVRIRMTRRRAGAPSRSTKLFAVQLNLTSRTWPCRSARVTPAMVVSGNDRKQGQHPPKRHRANGVTGGGTQGSGRMWAKHGCGGRTLAIREYPSSWHLLCTRDSAWRWPATCSQRSSWVATFQLSQRPMWRAVDELA